MLNRIVRWPTLVICLLLAGLLPFQSSRAALPVTSFPGQVFCHSLEHNLDLLVDVTVPSVAGPRPAVVFVHGGGWKSGSRTSFAGSQTTRLTDLGFVVASVDYRMTSTSATSSLYTSVGARFPAMLYDVKCAIRYLRANAASFNIDVNNMHLMGKSAGAHLALMAGLTGNAPAFEGLDQYSNSWPGHSSAVSSIVNWFGPTSLLEMYNTSAAARQDLPVLLGTTPDVNPGAYISASPTGNVSPSSPPILTLQGTADPVVPPAQADLLDQAVRTSGSGRIETIFYNDTHNFPDPTVSSQAWQETLRFLQQQCCPVATPVASATRTRTSTVGTNVPATRTRTNTRTSTRTATRTRTNTRTATRTRTSTVGTNVPATATRTRTRTASPTRTPTAGGGLSYQLTPLRSDATSDWFNLTVNNDVVVGVLGRPKGTGPFPAVLINHGKGGTLSFVHTTMGPSFVSAGYVVIGVSLNFGDFTTPFLSTEPENRRRAGVGLDVLGTLSYVDQSRVAVFGHSMGGYLTVGLIGQNPSGRIKVAAYTSAGIKYGSSQAEHESFVSQINAPLLLMHGTADPLPYTDTTYLADMMTRLGKPNKLVLFEGADHSLPATHTAQVTGEAIAYFNSNF